jgi:hypothetical protein
MVNRARAVQAREGEQGVGQQLVNFLRRMKDGGVRGDAEIQLEDPIVERPPVPEARNDADDRNKEHQDVEQIMDNERCAAAEFVGIRRQVRRPVRGPPEEPRNRESKIEQADADVDIDPERPRLSRNIVEKKAKGAEEEDQRGGRPMKDYRARAGVGAALCFTESLIGKWTSSRSRDVGVDLQRDLSLRAAVCSGLDRNENVLFAPGELLSSAPGLAIPSSQGPHHGIEIGAALIKFRNVVAVANERHGGTGCLRLFVRTEG